MCARRTESELCSSCVSTAKSEKSEREQRHSYVCNNRHQEPYVANTLDRSVVISSIIHPLYSEALFTRGFLQYYSFHVKSVCTMFLCACVVYFNILILAV